MSVTGSEQRLARKPYTKPNCTPRAIADRVGRSPSVQDLNRRLVRRGSAVLAVESYSGSLQSLVTAVDEAFGPARPPISGAAPPVIILLNSQPPSSPNDDSPGGNLNIWRMSGVAEARDIAAVLATLCAARIHPESRRTPLVLRGGANE